MPCPDDRPLRIGVAGPSCSGKSTIAARVAGILGARHLCLDDRYLRDHERRYVDADGEAIRSFEHPGAYDGAALLAAVTSSAGPVVAEGFLLFAYPGLAEAFDLRVFVELSWDEVRRRRAARTGQTQPKVDAAFDRIGEREWLVHGAPQGELPGMLRLDGRRSVEESVGRILAEAARPS